MQLARDFPVPLDKEAKDYGAAVRRVFVNPLNWPKVAVYLYVSVVSRLLSRQKLKAVDRYRWEKDQSSRSG